MLSNDLTSVANLRYSFLLRGQINHPFFSELTYSRNRSMNRSQAPLKHFDQTLSDRKLVPLSLAGIALVLLWAQG